MIGSTSNHLCPVAAAMAHLVTRGDTPGPLFCFINGLPLTLSVLVNQVKVAQAFQLGGTRTIVSWQEQLQRQQPLGQKTLSLRPWEDGKAPPTYYIFVFPRAQLQDIAAVLSCVSRLLAINIGEQSTWLVVLLWEREERKGEVGKGEGGGGGGGGEGRGGREVGGREGL